MFSESTEYKRTQFLRGIASSVPSRTINREKTRHKVLEAAFNEMMHPGHWKNPINVIMTFHESDQIGVSVYCDAIEYFTSTKPATFILTTELDPQGKQINTYRIVSEGYALSAAGG